MTRLTFTEGNHTYWLVDEQGKKRRVPSVSALVKTLHTFEGERWIIGETAETVAAHWDTIGYAAPPLRADMIRDLAHTAVATPRNYGTAVHHFCEQLWTGMPVEVPDEYVPHVTAVADWFRTHKVTVRHAETMVWAEPGVFGESGMAGRIDLLIDHPSRGLGILDLKTWQAGRAGTPKVEQWAMQLSAYASMEHLVINEQDEPMPRIDWASVLHVGPETAREYVLTDEQRAIADQQVTAARALKGLPKPSMQETT